MNSDEALKITELDRQVGSPRFQMLKAALPFFPVQQQGTIAILTKFWELQNTLRRFQSPQKTMQACGVSGVSEEPATSCHVHEQSTPPAPQEILEAIKPYGSLEDQSRINFAQNMLQAMSLYEQISAMQASQPEPTWQPEANTQNTEDTYHDSWYTGQSTYMDDAWYTNQPTYSEESWHSDRQSSNNQEDLTMQSWNNDPKLKNLDPQKLAYLMNMAQQSRGQSADNLMPFLMSMMNGNGQGMSFSDAETDQILQVLRSRMTPEEQGRIEMIRQMSRMMGQQKKS